jgi:hypothetical protein
MGLETGNTINDLNESWPLGTDPKSQGDDHIRLCKRVFKNDVLSTTNGGTISGDVDFAGDVSFAGNVTGLVQAANPNLIINGGFDIAQRGTNIPAPLGGGYTLDRWVSEFDATPTTASFRQIDFGASNPVTQSKYYFKYAVVAAGSCTTTLFGQRIENPNYFGGKTFTVSFKCLGVANGAITVSSQSRVNGVSEGLTTWGTFTPSNSAWNEYTFTATIPDTTAASIEGDYFYLYFTIPTADGTDVNLVDVKLEQGSVATPWFYEDYGTTLAKCQRYYQRYNYTTGQYIGTLQVYNTDGAFGVIKHLPVEMRISPIGLLSAASDFACTRADSAPAGAFATITLNTCTKYSIGTGGTSGSIGLVAGDATIFQAATDNAWIAVDAEL